MFKQLFFIIFGGLSISFTANLQSAFAKPSAKYLTMNENEINYQHWFQNYPNKFRKLNERELSEYLQDDVIYRHQSLTRKSSAPDPDMNIIQTYILNSWIMDFSEGRKGYFNNWDNFIFSRFDRDLTCLIESYYGILIESPFEKDMFRLSIIGRKRNDFSQQCSHSDYLPVLNSVEGEIELFKKFFRDK